MLTSGTRAVTKGSCSADSCFTMWNRHFSRGWGKKQTSMVHPGTHTQLPLPPTLSLPSQQWLITTNTALALTLLAGDAALLSESSSAACRSWRWERMKAWQGAWGAAHTSSSTRYAFFCMLRSLLCRDSQHAPTVKAAPHHSV